MAKSPHTPEWRAMVAKEYLDGLTSSVDIASKYNLTPKTVRRWAQRYMEHGILAFARGIGNSRYSSDFKKMCCEIYLDGEMSTDEITAKYNISSESVLANWIKMYNANRELEDYDPKREVYMAEARRKTTIKERKEAVAYCIEHERNYKETAIIFGVSYSQIYSWVKKYDTNGEEALLDKRGHHKTDDEVDELERLRRENLRLKQQLKEKDMLAELLKKVKELEGM